MLLQQRSPYMCRVKLQQQQSTRNVTIIILCKTPKLNWLLRHRSSVIDQYFNRASNVVGSRYRFLYSAFRRAHRAMPTVALSKTLDEPPSTTLL